MVIFSCNKKEPPLPNDPNEPTGHVLDGHLGEYTGTVYMMHAWCYNDSTPTQDTAYATAASVVDITLYGDSLINAIGSTEPLFTQNYLVGNTTSTTWIDSSGCSTCVDVYSIEFITEEDSLYIYRSSEEGTCASGYDKNTWDWRLKREP